MQSIKQAGGFIAFGAVKLPTYTCAGQQVQMATGYMECVFKLVILPLARTQKEITDIIQNIDNREGDLTKRVSMSANKEIATVGNGIQSEEGDGGI